MVCPAQCDTSKDESKDPGIALIINVAETTELWFQMVVSLAAAAVKQQQQA